jgi:hypothetical protein
MYNYLHHRQSLIDVVAKYYDKEDAVPNWKKATEELNVVFEEETIKQVWKKRYYRARRFQSKYITGDYSTHAQALTEGHLKRIGTIEQGRASVLTEEALKILEQQSEKIEFKKEMKTAKQDNEYVFITSDFHFDGHDEMLDTLKVVYKHVIAKQSEFGFKRIKLMELGDIVEGSHLRPSQLLAIKTMLIPQTIRVAQAYVQMLNELSKDMFIDFYCVTSSNHTQTRAFGTGRNELVEDDAMLIFVEIVKHAMINNKNVKITTGRDFIVDLTKNHRMFVSHGHLVDGKKNGYIQELAMARGVSFEYALFGHFHHYREITLYGRPEFNMKVFYAPSLNNKHSDYEFDKNLSSKAGMLMMVFNEERGHKYCEELFV